MKNFLKENWFKVVILLILTLIFCFYIFGYFLPKERQATLLNLQEKCSNQSEKFFTKGDNYKNSDGFEFNYTNHFNFKLNKCFILISATNVNDDYLSLDLYDVLEVKHFASYIGHSICNSTVLSMINKSNKCKMDSGNIWLDGNDSRNPADITTGFRGFLYGDSIGDENTQKKFIENIQLLFMND